MDDYYNIDLPGGSISTILTRAFNTLIEANVLCFEDGTSLQPAEVCVHGGRVMVSNLDGDPNVQVWANGRSFGGQEHPDDDSLPPIEGLVEALAYALVAILNSPPSKYPDSKPWSKN